MMRTIGIAIGTDIAPTSITTACLSLSTVSGGDFTRRITILITPTATRTTITTVTSLTITTVTHTVTTTLPAMMTSRAMAIHSNLWPMQRSGLSNRNLRGLVTIAARSTERLVTKQRPLLPAIKKTTT